MSRQEKTEAPTTKRRQEAREKGDVARSQELTSALMLLTSLFLVWAIAPSFWTLLVGQTLEFWRTPIFNPAETESVIPQLQRVALSVLRPLLLLFLMIPLAAFLGSFIQTGWFFLPKKLLPDWNRLNPSRLFSQIFSMQGLVLLTSSVLRFVFVLLTLLLILKQEGTHLIQIVSESPEEIFYYFISLLFRGLLYVILFLLFFAVLDYFWQRFRHEQDLRMTPQEIKEELRETQGDPILVSKRRQLQQQIRTQNSPFVNEIEDLTSKKSKK